MDQRMIVEELASDSVLDQCWRSTPERRLSGVPRKASTIWATISAPQVCGFRRRLLTRFARRAPRLYEQERGGPLAAHSALREYVTRFHRWACGGLNLAEATWDGHDC